MDSYIVKSTIDKSTKLLEYKSNTDPIEYSKYIISVNNQRVLNPDFPKLDTLLPFTSNTKYTEQQLINILKSDSYTYLGIRELNSTHHWEFCKINSSIETSQFIYVKITEANLLIVSSLLPSETIFNNKQQVQDIYYPSKQILFFYNDSFINRFYSIDTEDLTHPYLPYFYYSGKTLLISNQLYYEYFDSKGLYGPLYQNYLTNIRPYYLDFPVGLPTSFTNKDCFIADKNHYPLFSTKTTSGFFTGYTHYFKDIIFYIYYRKDNTIFASQYPPSPINPYIPITPAVTPNSNNITQISNQSTIELILEAIS